MTNKDNKLNTIFEEFSNIFFNGNSSNNAIIKDSAFVDIEDGKIVLHPRNNSKIIAKKYGDKETTICNKEAFITLANNLRKFANDLENGILPKLNTSMTDLYYYNDLFNFFNKVYGDENNSYKFESASFEEKDPATNKIKANVFYWLALVKNKIK